MSEQGWQELRVRTRPDALESLEDWLLANGALAVSLEDAADQPLLEPGPGETPLWDDITVVGLFPLTLDLQRLLATAAWLDAHGPTIRYVADRDWTRAWMADFAPLQMGPRLWVCPSWSTPPDPQAVNVVLDPGLAFGTGTHPTTAMCLGALDQWVVEGQQVVDFGCGSGILAVAALKLGAAAALGVDNDPQAITASADNAGRNGIAPSRFAVVMPDSDVIADWAGRADIVVANILANPLLALRDHITGLLRPGGRLLLAGLLADQAALLIEGYAERLPLAVVDQQQEWVLLGGVSPGPAVP